MDLITILLSLHYHYNLYVKPGMAPIDFFQKRMKQGMTLSGFAYLINCISSSILDSRE